MKLIGLVAPANSQKLSDLADFSVAKDFDLGIEKLTINIAAPKYDEKNTAIGLAGAICVSTSDETKVAGLKDFLRDAKAEVIFSVEERCYWDLKKEDSASINQMTFVCRLSEITHQEFSKRWDQHAPIAKEHHPGIARYTQNVIHQREGKFSDPDLAASFEKEFDGVAELFFHSMQDMADGMRKDETSTEIVYADINRFLDLEAGTRIFAKQYLRVAED